MSFRIIRTLARRLTIIPAVLLFHISVAAPADSVETVQQGKLVPAQSWDQENLKRNDHGCPTAIFFVNQTTGLLEQCALSRSTDNRFVERDVSALEPKNH